MSHPGSPQHLVTRFFGSLRARRPTPADQVRVAQALTPTEARLFWAQPPMDQHHAVVVAARVGASVDDPVLTRAALLHDVGKRHSRAGVIRRSVASALALVHLPTSGRLRTYLDHGPLGAADLLTAGSPDLVVAFAESHHGKRPPGFPEVAWNLLSIADDS